MAARAIRAGAAGGKLLHFARHGQAVHNVRAEPLRKAGCSYQAFVDQMAADDAFDAPLTEVGVRQAAEAGALALEMGLLRGVELAVASPLSRALDTADALMQPLDFDRGGPRRAVLEELREINGLLLNAKRRPRGELEVAYPHWDFSAMREQDELWTEELESKEACAERGCRALGQIWDAEESEVLVVAHGGLFSFLFGGLDPRVRADERLRARFGNCEVRSALLTAEGSGESATFVLRSLAGEAG